MGKTLKSYFIREITWAFLIGLFLLSAVLFVHKIIRLVELVVNQGVPAKDVILLFSALLPSFLQFTLPMALLLALLITLGQMAEDKEITAWKSCGVSLLQMAQPVFIFTIIIFCSHLYLGLHLIPATNKYFSQKLFHLALTKTGVVLREHVFINDFHGFMIYLDKIDQKKNSFENVLVADETSDGPPNIIFAKHGRLLEDEARDSLTLQLEEGTIHIRQNDLLAYQMLKFGKYQLDLDLEAKRKQAEMKVPNERQMNLAELLIKIESSGHNEEESFPYLYELHSRISQSAACFVFALIGLSLGVMPQLTSRAAGFSMSLLIFVLYYFLFTLGEDFGGSGKAPPWLMAWMPNIVFGLLGVYLFHLANNEKTPLPLVWVGRIRTYYLEKINPRQ